MKNNNKWFSLVIAMGLTLVITILALTVLEYIIPFSRDIKWVENSSKAYYQANTWIEEWLYKIYERNWSWVLDNRNEYSKDFTWTISNKYNTYSSWSILPPVWEWNSEYDNDWGTISSWNPLQLLIWEWYITSWTNNVFITFRVPDIENSTPTLSWNTLPIISWQLSSIGNTLNSTGSHITADKINSTDNVNSLIYLLWRSLDWNDVTIENFYTSNCSINNPCKLNFFVVNKIESEDWKILPYLEWKLDTDWNNIPLNYTKLESSWKSYWFKKDINIKVPSETVNEIFDFTVFQ